MRRYIGVCACRVTLGPQINEDNKSTIGLSNKFHVNYIACMYDCPYVDLTR